MTLYSETFKTKMVQRMLVPHGKPMAALARETGVPEPTLYRWRNAATLPVVTKPTKTPHEWTAEQKLAVVLEAAAVPDAELGEFLRRKGLHEAQLQEWRAAATAGLRGPSQRDRKAANVEARRVRELERELARKDKALAEAAALLILKKKVQAIWGDEDDDTPPGSDK